MRSMVLVMIAAVALATAGDAQARRAVVKPIRRIPPSVQVAQNAQSAKCEAVEFAAERTGKPYVDPKLSRFKGKLAHPPFSAYDTFTVTGEQSFTAQKGKAATAKMSSTLTVLLKNIITSQGKKPRLQMGIDVDDPSGTRFYSVSQRDVDSGDITFLSAGQDSKKRDLFIALVCTI